jgi:hypothetical protein
VEEAALAVLSMVTDELFKRDSQFKLGSWASDEKIIHFNKKKRVKYLKNRPL